MKKIVKYVLVPLLFALFAFFVSYFHVFSSVNFILTDNLYSQLRTTNKDIMLVTIDEDTLNEYGSFVTWSRDKIADAVTYLYAKEGAEPSVVGIDITFQGDGTKSIDDKLAKACSGNKDIVVSAPIVFKGSVTKNANGETEYDAYSIDMIEFPFNQLSKVTTPAFTNAFTSSDEICRSSKYSFVYKGEEINSFSYKIASIYAEKKGIEIPKVNKDNTGLFRFFYAGKAEGYSHVSLKTLLSGNVPQEEFAGKIVLIGAYATGMQDAYFATSDVGTLMNGVEIHANIIQSFLDGTTAKEVDNLFYSIILAVIIFLIAIIANNFNYVISILSIIACGVAHVFLGKYLANNGLIIPQFATLMSLAILLFYFVIRRFITEIIRRRHITSVFNRYMDPKIVSRLAKNENQEELKLTGEKKDVAVLFVDIRGFTSMSENMEPEDVVVILNEYLELVTNCIFKHNGMLDKFIGDAAMAVFNAPLDQDDYIYEAVATAYDIAKGSEPLSKKLLEKYGKTVSYGVGVHCGKAVIGNIGCKTRMDYTAIGDTVNTSARLEANAPRDTVYISKKVVDELGDRITVESVGNIPLKGKSEELEVFKLLSINNS